MWGKVRRDVRGEKKCGGMCGRVYGVSVENVRKCVDVWESYGWGGGGWGSWSQERLSGELGSWGGLMTLPTPPIPTPPIPTSLTPIFSTPTP